MKERFNTYSNWNNYLPLLFEALEKTTGLVLEYGMGDGSTKLLHDYCQQHNRKLISYDSDHAWANKFRHLATSAHKIYHVKDWDEAYREDASVVLIDHSPGERRQIDIKKYSSTKAIIIAHDTEPAADYGYQMRQHFSLFNTIVEIKSDGAWTAMLSH